MATSPKRTRLSQKVDVFAENTNIYFGHIPETLGKQDVAVTGRKLLGKKGLNGSALCFVPTIVSEMLKMGSCLQTLYCISWSFGCLSQTTREPTQQQNPEWSSATVRVSLLFLLHHACNPMSATEPRDCRIHLRQTGVYLYLT